MEKVSTESRTIQTRAVRDQNHAVFAENSGNGKWRVVAPGGINHQEANMPTDKNGSPPRPTAFDGEREIAELKHENEKLMRRNQELLFSLIDVDSKTADSQAQIMSVSRMAIAYLERPEAYEDPDILADAFSQIVRTVEACQTYSDDRVRDVEVEPHSEKRGNKRLLALLNSRKVELF